MKISKRFIIINILSSITIILIVFFIFISIDFFYQKKKVLNQLKNINKTISDSVSVLLSITVEDHLKMISQKNNITINKIIEQLNNGIIDKNYAKDKIKNLLKSEKIGKTGYVFIWNIKDAPEKIILDLHPEIEGENVANIDFVQTGYKNKNGYIEYIWKSPSEPERRYKSMYLNYVPELDWIICYSSYRDEFYYLFDMERLKKIILNIKIIENGTSYIIDFNGNVIVHPHIKNRNLLNVKDIKNKYFIREIIEKKEGSVEYYWVDYSRINLNEEAFDIKLYKNYKKIAYFSPIKEFNIIMVSTVFYKDVFNYHNKFLIAVIASLLIFIILIVFLTISFTSKLLSPIYQFKDKIDEILLDSSYKDLVLKEELYFNNERDEIKSFSSFIESIFIDLNDLHKKIQKDYENEKLLKEEFNSQKIFMSMILDILPAGICVVDDKFRILIYNSYLYNNVLLKINNQLKDKELNGGYIDDFFNTKDLFFNLFLKVRENGEMVQTKLEIFDNEKIILNIIVKPFFEKEVIKYVIYRIDDITEESLRIEREIAMQKNQSIANFIKGLSHDINNYIGAIIGGSNILSSRIDEEIDSIDKIIKNYNESSIASINEDLYNNIFNKLNDIKSNLEKDYKSDLEIIYNSAKKSSNLLKKFNIVNREKDKEFQYINLIDLISRVMDIIKPTLGKDIKIDINYYKNINFFTKGIEDQIESVFMNLLVNAYHAVSSKSNVDNINNFRNITVKLEIIKQDNSTYNKIMVEDNGIGIPKKNIPRIFDPFFTTKPKDKGSGLGLYLVKQIVQKHNGYIDLISEENIGTKFLVYLPYYDMKDYIFEHNQKEELNNKEKNNEKINNNKIDNNKNYINKINNNSINILIVDDDDDFRYFLAKGLQSYGFNVKEAKDGFQAIDIFQNKNNKINFVILDRIMSGIDGYETFNRLKNIDENIKTIMMTGFIEDEILQNYKKSGILEIIQKPFDLSLLYKNISIYI